MTALMGHQLDHDTWLAERRKAIGASESAILLDVSPYRGTLALYLDKLGQLPPEPQSEAMSIGLLAEPLLEALYERRAAAEGFTRARWRNQVYHRSDRWPWIAATFDLLRDDGRPVELKYVLGSGEAWGEEGTDEIPEHYVIQCQHQMAVSGADRAGLFALVHGRPRSYTIARNEDLIALIVERGQEFMARVRHRDPDPAWEKEATPRALAILHPPTGQLVEATPEQIAWAAEYEALGAQAREIGDRREDLKVALLAALRGDTAALPDGRWVRSRTREVKGYTVAPRTDCYLSIAKPPKGVA